MRYFLIILILLFSCEHSFEPIKKFESEWIAATARINGENQIVIIDFHNPENFRQLTNDNNENFYPRISPDKTRLIYLREKPENTSGSRVVLCLLDGFKRELTDSTFPGFYVVANIPVIWSPDGSKIFFRFRSYYYSDDLVFYDFFEKRVTFLKNTEYPSEYAVAFKNTDTLIVFSNDTLTTKGYPGFYLMDMNGNYVSYIENPHLELVNRNGVNLKAAYNPDWNNRLGLFVYAQVDSTFPGYKIAITDLKGNVYRTFTSGKYIDDFPVWGPGDYIILFQRQPIDDYNGFHQRLMVLNLKTGDVREFVDPASINNATALSYPDY